MRGWMDRWMSGWMDGMLMIIIFDVEDRVGFMSVDKDDYDKEDDDDMMMIMMVITITIPLTLFHIGTNELQRWEK